MDKNKDIASKEFLYRFINNIEDKLIDSHHSHKAVPNFANAVNTARKACSLPANTQQSGPMHESLKNDNIEKIVKDIRLCRACRLFSSRRNTVPGFGSIRPLVMVIGEGPGAEEDDSGLPFVGPAGKLLDKMLAAIGLSRDTNCYISNIVKCRPPHNRDPAPDEQASCMPFLERQIAVLNPGAFLTIGRIPTQAFLNTKESLGHLRGRAYDYLGKPLVVTYHPSALLRDDSLKRPAWEDLKILKAILDGFGQ